MQAHAIFHTYLYKPKRMGIIMLISALRTIFIYMVLVLSIRFTGKRQIGELQLSELVVTILLSEIAAVPIIDTDKPVMNAIVPALILIALEVLLSFLIIKVPIIKRIFYGKPSYIIYKGELNQRELFRQRLGMSELLSALRQDKIADISDVEYCILEENGKLSIFPKVEKGGVTVEQLNLKSPEDGIGHALILDRKVIKDNMKLIGWDMKQLNKVLKGQLVENVFLFSVDDVGNITIIIKDKK